MFSFTICQLSIETCRNCRIPLQCRDYITKKKINETQSFSFFVVNDLLMFLDGFIRLNIC